MGEIYHCLLIDETTKPLETSVKASFLRHHLPRNINRGQIYASGTGVVFYPLMLATTAGHIQFNLWDSDNVRGKCQVPVDCVIIFHSLDSFVSGRKGPHWEKKVYYLTERMKLVLVLCPYKTYTDGKINLFWTSFMLKKPINLLYNQLDDLESPQNIEDVFLWFARQLKNDMKLQLFTYPVFLPKFFAKMKHLPKCFYCLQKEAFTMAQTSNKGFGDNLCSQAAGSLCVSKLSLSSDTSEERSFEQRMGDHCECGVKVNVLKRFNCPLYS